MNDPIELVIFDCDGVLVDSEPVAARLMVRMLGELGLVTDEATVMRRFVGLDPPAARARIAAEDGIELPHDYEAGSARRLAEAFEAELAAFDGVERFLTALDLPFCVASNSGHDRLAATFRIAGLAPLVAGRVFSAEDVARGKPAPDLFLHAAARMGIAPARAVVVEDSVTGVTAARAAGMRVIGFCGGGHVGPDHADRLAALGATTIARTYAELDLRLAALRGRPPFLPSFTETTRPDAR